MYNYYVYIMINKYNKVLYVGVTNNLARRVNEHKQGLVEGFTKQHNVCKLVYAEKYSDIKTAILREKQIKSWRRVTKEELINKVNPDWEEFSPII